MSKKRFTGILRIEECIVGGLPDPSRGRGIRAWIKLKDKQTLTVEELKAFIEDKVSSYEMPRKFEFRDKPLPKTMIGKLHAKILLLKKKQKCNHKQHNKKHGCEVEAIMLG